MMPPTGMLRKIADEFMVLDGPGQYVMTDPHTSIIKAWQGATTN